MLLYRGKPKNWKRRFKSLMFWIFLFMAFMICQQWVIYKFYLKINVLKERLSIVAFREDSKDESQDEASFHSKKTKERIKNHNLGLYKKTYEFFDFPFSNMSESYTPFPSAEYGYRGDAFHPALDIQSPYDGDVLSSGDGVVYKVGEHYYAGKYVVIYHSIDGEEFLSVYHHLTVIDIVEKQRLKKGEKIGIIGNSGKASTGIHLHFALYKKIKTRWVSVNFVSNSVHKRPLEIENRQIYRFLLK